MLESEPKMDDADWINIEGWRLKVKNNKCKRLKIIKGVSEKMKV